MHHEASLRFAGVRIAAKAGNDRSLHILHRLRAQSARRQQPVGAQQARIAAAKPPGCIAIMSRQGGIGRQSCIGRLNADSRSAGRRVDTAKRMQLTVYVCRLLTGGWQHDPESRTGTK